MSVTRNAETQHRAEPDPTGSTDSTSADPRSTFTARERWALAGASLWLVVGLQLDAFAHATLPDP
jgi:hypothetical protein